ncbi:hypothetical protein PHYPSEUDO_010154 [Phytophthora pseudosyringae]|uniref:Transmembrane protein n=1 Tax=Phytophthora pseudosyringae TaxID=221518 RepID=A0A8T1VDT0_9STRA|nr:hypothetical protein PHYPSEUDO_010154 [Phytophthora pseudosyringae]
MGKFRRIWRRAYRLCESFQVELRGHYSADRIRNLDAYCHKTSTLWSFLVCVVSPFPCLLVVTATDYAPMAPPEDGSRANYIFWIRDWLAIALMTRAILEQFRVSIPGLHINTIQVITMPIIAGGGAAIFMIAMSSIVGFPLPFALVVGIPVWFVVVLVCFICCFGRVLRTDPALFQELISSIVVLVCQVLLTFVYPAYLYGFIHVQPSNQKFYLVLLPVIKIFAKNYLSHFLGTKFDLMPQIIVFNVDVFNALYVSSSMQNSSSISTMLSMIGLDVAQAWMSISDIGHLMKTIRLLQRKIPAGHPLESASFIEIALQLIKEDAQAKAHLSLHCYSSALEILRSQDKRSIDSVNSVGGSTDVTPRSSRRVIPVAATGAPLLVAAVETFTPLHQDESSRRRSLLENVFSPWERRLFVLRTAQVLFTTEFVILVEYTEVIVPFIFCMYTLAMYQLPNRAYYSQVAALDGEGLGSKLESVVMFGGIELLSLLAFGFIIHRKIGISILRLLSFVLDRGWRMVQANLFLWIFYTVQNSLEHNGADFSWSFIWLKSK